MYQIRICNSLIINSFHFEENGQGQNLGHPIRLFKSWNKAGIPASVKNADLLSKYIYKYP